MFLVYCDHMEIMVIVVAFVGINWVWIWEKNLCWGLIDSELKTGIKARKSAQSIQVQSHILRTLKLGRKQENVELKASLYHVVSLKPVLTMWDSVSRKNKWNRTSKTLTMSMCLSFCLSDSVAHVGNQTLGLEHCRLYFPLTYIPSQAFLFILKRGRSPWLRTISLGLYMHFSSNGFLML